MSTPSQKREGSVSEISRTDLLPKTSYFFTTVNLFKSFIGLGILAAPSGFASCGFLLGFATIAINGVLNGYTVYLQARAKNIYGRRVKNYSDLGYACFGSIGKSVVAFTILFNQVLCCIGYVMFFLE